MREDKDRERQGRAVYLAEWLDRLCRQVGSRAPGSAGERAAGALVLREMQSILGSAEREWFQMMGWEARSSSFLEVDGRVLESYLFFGSASTPDTGYEGRLVCLDAEASQFGLLVEGLPAPAARLSVSPYGPAVASLVRPFGGLPTFGVGIHHQPLLEEAARKGHRVLAKGLAGFLPGVWSSNILGVIPGRSERELVFCAHYDTQYNSPGANDNAASLVVMLLLARELVKEAPELSIRFIATGAEEEDCLGAKSHVEGRRRTKTGDRIAYCINFDSLTYGPHLHFTSPNPTLLESLEQVHRDLKPATKPVFRVDPFPTLDEEPFYRAGAQAVHVNSRGYDEQTLRLWHRPEDLPETVHPHLVEDSFVFFREVARRLAETR